LSERTQRRSLQDLAPTEFENLCFDLLSISGLRNLAWRTPGSDVGRDLEGVATQVDFSGSHVHSRWFIDCKRYSTSIPWPVVWEKISYGDSQDADYVLIVTQSTFSPQCIDQVNQWNSRKKRPQVRLWARHDIDVRLSQFQVLRAKYELDAQPTAPAAIAPLAEQLARLTISAGDSFAFGATDRIRIDAAVGMAALLMTRTDDLARHGRFVRRPANQRSVSYDWIDTGENLNVAAFDALFLRAVLPLMAVGVSAKKMGVAHSTDGGLAVTPIGDHRAASMSLDQSLSIVAVWGCAEISATDTGYLIRPQESRNGV
jgi:hypothetical protein